MAGAYNCAAARFNQKLRLLAIQNAGRGSDMRTIKVTCCMLPIAPTCNSLPRDL
jgi:hypothetical protein